MVRGLSSLNISTPSPGILPCQQLPSVSTFYFKVEIHLLVLMRYFEPPGSLHTDLLTPAIAVKHLSDNIVHTSPGNCSPASNSSASVMTGSYSK